MARYWHLQDALARERTGQRRQKRDASLYEHVPDQEFVDCFWVTPELFENLCVEVVPLLPPKQNSRGIDPTLKVLIALKFFGRGDYQGGVGRDQSIPMSQQAVSKCLKQVTLAFNNAQLIQRHVHFPQNQAERVRSLKLDSTINLGCLGLAVLLTAPMSPFIVRMSMRRGSSTGSTSTPSIFKWSVTQKIGF